MKLYIFTKLYIILTKYHVDIFFFVYKGVGEVGVEPLTHGMTFVLYISRLQFIYLFYTNGTKTKPKGIETISPLIGEMTHPYNTPLQLSLFNLVTLPCDQKKKKTLLHYLKNIIHTLNIENLINIPNLQSHTHFMLEILFSLS